MTVPAPAGAPSAMATDRSATAGVVLAFAAHLLLLGLLSLAWTPPRPRVWPEPVPLEVSLVTDVAPTAQAPPVPTPPAPSVAPDTGVPEDAAPPPAPARQPVVEPAPAQPAPVKPAAVKPVPAKPAPAKSAPAPRPVAAAKPQPASPAKPAPTARPQPATPVRPASATAPAKPAPARAPSRSDRLAGLATSIGEGSRPAASTARTRGQRLGNDFLAGLSPDAPSRKPSAAAPASRAGPYPTASIVGAIARQIQPCADRQVNPGPGANRILTTLNIRLNADGSLAATPTKVRQGGVDDENERYAQRVVDLGIAAFKGCSPLRLPSEYYQTANGGWSNINYQWKLR